MPRKLLAVIAFAGLLPWRPCVAEHPASRLHTDENKPAIHVDAVPSDGPTVRPFGSNPCSKIEPCYTEDEIAENALPRWLRPEWVIVYVTVAYSIITWLTLRSIKRQADIMETQAGDARKNAAEATITTNETLAALKRQADAMASQIHMMKDKERARVEVKALSLELTALSDDFWQIVASIEFRNVGMGRAYIRDGMGTLTIDNEGNAPGNLSIVGGYIDPNAAPTKESFYFFREKTSRAEYSQEIYEGTHLPLITGFIEYETVGTRFRRDFQYMWIGQSSPFSISRMLQIDFLPETDEEKVSSGHWTNSWISKDNNTEYEVVREGNNSQPEQPA